MEWMLLTVATILGEPGIMDVQRAQLMESETQCRADAFRENLSAQANRPLIAKELNVEEPKMIAFAKCYHVPTMAEEAGAN